MGREVWSQAGEPTWAIEERLHRLERRVDQLAELVRELAASMRDLPADQPTTGRSSDRDAEGRTALPTSGKPRDGRK